MTQKQMSDLTMELLNKSFQPYLEKYPKTELDWTIDYPDFKNKRMTISVISNSNRLNENLSSKCIMMNFIPQLIETNLFKSDNKSWVSEVVNKDYPNVLDYEIYVR